MCVCVHHGKSIVKLLDGDGENMKISPLDVYDVYRLLLNGNGVPWRGGEEKQNNKTCFT